MPQPVMARAMRLLWRPGGHSLSANQYFHRCLNWSWDRLVEDSERRRAPRTSKKFYPRCESSQKKRSSLKGVGRARSLCFQIRCRVFLEGMVRKPASSYPRRRPVLPRSQVPTTLPMRPRNRRLRSRSNKSASGTHRDHESMTGRAGLMEPGPSSLDHQASWWRFDDQDSLPTE